MKNGYYLAILILLMLSSMALTASASSMNRWEAQRYSDAYGNEMGQEANQAMQTPNQVSMTLYVLDGSPNGMPLSGVDVKVYDAAGNSIGGVTDQKGSIVLNGQAGTWQFTLAKAGYITVNLEYTITKSQVSATYLLRNAPLTSSQIPAGNAAYQQGADISNKATETTIAAPIAQPVQSESVSIKIDVYETSLNGAPLSGVQVAGQDAAGKNFKGTTDDSGAVVLSGQPGTWKFSFAKEGYKTINLNYNVTETKEVAAYIQKSVQATPKSTAQTASQTQGLVQFTVYVHEGDLNGTALSGVQVTGQDAAGKDFEGTTDASGAAVFSGQPGAWKFSFAKDGYGPLSLSYNVTGNDYGDAFLQSADQSTQSAEPIVSGVEPSQTYQESSQNPSIQTISSSS